MWRTSTGERTLTGAEAAIFRVALSLAWENVDFASTEEDGWESGIGVFDSLQQNQRIALLAAVGRSLLESDAEPLELVAVTEAAIGATFRSLEEAVAVEIDHAEEDDGTYYRQLILDALADAELSDLPDARCEDGDEWHNLIDILASNILWDYDFEDECYYADLPPEQTAQLKDKLGVADNYFTAVAPDPSDSEVEECRVVIRSLIKPAS